MDKSKSVHELSDSSEDEELDRKQDPNTSQSSQQYAGILNQTVFTPGGSNPLNAALGLDGPDYMPLGNPEIKLNSTELKDENNDIWIMRTPADFDASTLKKHIVKIGASLSFGEVEVQKDNVVKKYKFRCTKFTDSVTMHCLVMDTDRGEPVLESFLSSGEIVVTESIDVPKPQYLLPVGKREKVSLPEGLKLRHPLYGADFQAYIDKCEPFLKSPSKKKKRKKSKHSYDETDSKKIETLSQTPQEEESSPNKSKKKKKRKRDEEESFNDTLVEEPVSKKLKIKS